MQRGGWSGTGIYYGGMPNPDKCGDHRGGFAGVKLDGEAKGAQSSVGLVIRVAKAAKPGSLGWGGSSLSGTFFCTLHLHNA